MSKVTYNVIYQVCGQVTTDIPDDITSVIGWFKVENGKIVSDDKTYDETEPVLFFAEPFEKELVVVVDKKFFDGSGLRERLFDLAEERRKKEC